jgi:hypothetical protein
MIAIPNMSKPKSCYNHCLEEFIANEEIGCPLKDYIESHQYKNAIHPNCPLIDIVRCGECNLMRSFYDDGREVMICQRTNLPTQPIRFCSEGERRSDGHI